MHKGIFQLLLRYHEKAVSTILQTLNMNELVVVCGTTQTGFVLADLEF